jgi:hypothetical protein
LCKNIVKYSTVLTKGQYRARNTAGFALKKRLLSSQRIEHRHKIDNVFGKVKEGRMQIYVKQYFSEYHSSDEGRSR